jgi:hypothetical protein
LRTVQLALEILTGACATLPDPEFDVAPEEGEDDIDGDGEILKFMFYRNGYNLRLDVDPDAPVADVDMEEDPKTVNVPTTPPRLFFSLVSPLLALVYPTSLSLLPLAAPSAHPSTTSVLSAIHVDALECLNNVFLLSSTSPNPSISTDTAGLRYTCWDRTSYIGCLCPNRYLL